MCQFNQCNTPSVAVNNGLRTTKKFCAEHDTFHRCMACNNYSRPRILFGPKGRLMVRYLCKNCFDKIDDYIETIVKGSAYDVDDWFCILTPHETRKDFNRDRADVDVSPIVYINIPKKYAGNLCIWNYNNNHPWPNFSRNEGDEDYIGIMPSKWTGAIRFDDVGNGVDYCIEADHNFIISRLSNVWTKYGDWGYTQKLPAKNGHILFIISHA